MGTCYINSIFTNCSTGLQEFTTIFHFAFIVYLQISSFTVSPNYEIVFFSSEIFEVVNILDFFDGKEVKLHDTLKNFKVEGEWHIYIHIK